MKNTIATLMICLISSLSFSQDKYHNTPTVMKMWGGQSIYASYNTNLDGVGISDTTYHWWGNGAKYYPAINTVSILSSNSLDYFRKFQAKIEKIIKTLPQNASVILEEYSMEVRKVNAGTVTLYPDGSSLDDYVYYSLAVSKKMNKAFSKWESK